MPKKLTQLYIQECTDFCKNFTSKLDEETRKEINEAQWLFQSEKCVTEFASYLSHVYNDLALQLFEIIGQIDEYMKNNDDFETLLENNDVFHITLDDCHKLFPDNEVNNELRYSQLKDFETDKDLDLNYILTREMFKEISKHLDDVFYTVRNTADIKTPKCDDEEYDVGTAQEFLTYQLYLKCEKEWSRMGSVFAIWYDLLDEIDEAFNMEKHWKNKDKFSIIEYYSAILHEPITQKYVNLVETYSEKVKDFAESFGLKNTKN